MASKDSVALNVFAKAPEPGKVKTRLIAAIGKQAATAVYISLLNNTVRAAAQSQLNRIALHVAGNSRHAAILGIQQQYGYPVYAQQGEGLGARMSYALTLSLAGNAGAILVGCDCAGLTANDLNQAQAALLAGNDVVLGPSTDGGYYLVGLRKPYPELFTGMVWSTDTVLAETIERVNRLGLQLALISEHTDIDCPADLVHLDAGFANGMTTG